ncbi:MAG TPA: hypothetical protein VH333_04555 [Pseudonocardiaceae bacterium]|jgi:hypothetical protein|nr:hypothetical protein [Pseudonocardiaceae bacterium]
MDDQALDPPNLPAVRSSPEIEPTTSSGRSVFGSIAAGVTATSIVAFTKAPPDLLLGVGGAALGVTYGITQLAGIRDQLRVRRTSNRLEQARRERIRLWLTMLSQLLDSSSFLRRIRSGGYRNWRTELAGWTEYAVSVDDEDFAVALVAVDAQLALLDFVDFDHDPPRWKEFERDMRSCLARAIDASKPVVDGGKTVTGSPG